MIKDRAAAIVIRGEKILMVTRQKDGVLLHMLPGGTLEEGETPEQAVVRELKEETSVEAILERKIETFVEPSGKRHHIFGFKYVSGEPSIHSESPKALQTDKNTVYNAVWVELNTIKNLDIWPTETKRIILNKISPTLYIMCGQAFSGKSTLAKEIARYVDATLVSQDAIWFEKEKDAKLSGQKPDYHAVLEISKQKIRETLKLGRSAVFDNTNAGFKHREEFRQIADECEAEAIVVYLNTSDEELNKRQELNRVTKERHEVNEEEIQKVRDRFEAPTLNEDVIVYLPNEDVPRWLEKSIKVN